MNKLMTDIGENYEYIRIIVENEIELKKLNFIEQTSKVVGMGILSFILLTLGFLGILSLSAILIVALTSYLGSKVLGLLSFIGILIVLGIFLLIFRKRLILNPSRRLFYSFVKNMI